jgi:hypothetical protein
MYEPLPFVNRYAEALDVLVPNLANHQALLSGKRIKYVSPLAAQPPGTGKTALGENITAILRRPRDDAAAEAAIAKRLAGAWWWQGQTATPAIARALRDPRDENLVMRTLMAMSDPVHHETLLALKDTQPLIIEMKGLVKPRFGLDFDGALAYAIFCAARGLDGSEPSTEDAFLAQRKLQQTAVGAVKAVIQERRGPVMLVLDRHHGPGGPQLQGVLRGRTARLVAAPRHVEPVAHAAAAARHPALLRLLHGAVPLAVLSRPHRLWLAAERAAHAAAAAHARRRAAGLARARRGWRTHSVGLLGCGA